MYLAVRADVYLREIGAVDVAIDPAEKRVGALGLKGITKEAHAAGIVKVVIAASVIKLIRVVGDLVCLGSKLVRAAVDKPH